MKNFLLNVLASIIAAVFILGVSWLLGLVGGQNTVFLNVESTAETYGNLQYSKIVAQQSGPYAIDSLVFVPRASDSIFALSLSTPEKNYSIRNPKPNEPVFMGTIGHSEPFNIVLLSSATAFQVADIKKMFTGRYLSINDRGIIQINNIVVRSSDEAKLETYKLVAIWTGLLVLIVTVAGVSMWLYRKFKKKAG